MCKIVKSWESSDKPLIIYSAAPFTCPEEDLTGSISHINSRQSYDSNKESQPDNFQCDIEPKSPAVILSKVDVYVSTSVTLSALALKQWADYQERFRYIYSDTDIKFVSSKAPGVAGLHTKEIMWAIRILLCHFNRNPYVAVSLMVKYENNPPIGFGQVLSTVPTSGSSSIEGNMTNGTTKTSIDTQGGTFNDTQSLSQPLIGQDTETNDITITDLHSGGEAFRPYIIYSIITSIFVSEAEFDDKDAATPGVVGFDSEKEWSIAVIATSIEAMDNLTHRTVILALANLAARMPTVSPARLRWHELNFRVRSNGAIVGRGYLRKEVTPPSITEDDTVAVQ